MTPIFVIETLVFSLTVISINVFFYLIAHSIGVKVVLDQGSIGTSPMYSIGSPPKNFKDTSSTFIDTCLLPLLKVMGCG